MYDGKVVRSMTNLEETQYGETMSCPRAWPTLIGWQPLVPDFDIPKFVTPSTRLCIYCALQPNKAKGYRSENRTQGFPALINPHNTLIFAHSVPGGADCSPHRCSQINETTACDNGF